jgi:hypothetical protein
MMNRLKNDRLRYQTLPRLLGTFSIFAVFAFVVTNPQNLVGQADTFQPFSNDNLGISLKKPSDWSFVSLKNGFQLIKEKDSVYLEIRKSNAQPSSTTLEQVANNDIHERFTSRKNFQLLNLSKTVISGTLPAYKAVYEFLKTKNDNIPIGEVATNKVIRITTFAGGVAYIIKYVSEKEKYETYLPIAEKIIDSLKFNIQENEKAKSGDNNNENNNNNKPTAQQIRDCNRILDTLGENNAIVIADIENGIAVFGNGTHMGCDDLKQFWKDELAFRQSVKDYDAKAKQEQNTGGKGKITVGYGDLGSYRGTGRVVIKNIDTGKTLVTHDLNFAKQRDSQGNGCCVKTYTFDSNLAHNGDALKVVVTGGGGSWESGPEIYKDNLRVSMTLDEIGENESGNFTTTNNNNYDNNDYNNGDSGNFTTTNNNNYENDNNGYSNGDNNKDNSDEYICDSDPSTTAPSCDDFLQEQQKENDNNDNNDENNQEEFELPPEEPEFEDEVTGNISSS